MNTALPCPTCGHPTTPSSIGNVCIGCEKVWPHNAVHHSQLHPPTVKHQPTQPSSKAPSGYPKIRPTYLIDHEATEEEAAEMQAGYEYKLRSRLKRLVVPELPSSLDESRSLAPAKATPPLTVNPRLALDLADFAHPTTPLRSHKPADNASQSPIHIAPQSAASAGSISATELLVTAGSIPPPKADPDMPAEPLTPAALPREPAKEELPLNQASSSEASEDEIATTEPQWVLLSTIGVIIVVIAIGAWLTVQSRSTPTRVRSTSQPQTATQPKTSSNQSVSADITKRDAQRKQDLHDIATALEVYRQQQGTYPVGEDIAVVYPLQYTTPPYISFVNYDPLSSDSKKIKYAYSSNGTSFSLQAKLENTSDSEAQGGYYTIKSK